MNRELWVLFQYSSVYGAPTTPVAVLGVEERDDGLAAHVEWLREEPGEIWPERLSVTSPEDLPALLSIWQHDTSALAAPVDDVSTGADLVAAVRGHRAHLAAAA